MSPGFIQVPIIRSRRSVLVLCLLTIISVVACGGGGASSANNTVIPPVQVSGPDNNPIGPIPPGAPIKTQVDRAMAIAAGIIARQQADGSWWFDDEGKIKKVHDAYSGQAGILIVLARVYQKENHAAIKDALNKGVAWLRAQDLRYTNAGLYSGKAGIAYAYLEVYQALKDPQYLNEALALANDISDNTLSLQNAPGDLISGHVGSGFFYLRLYELDKQTKWLEIAKKKADEALRYATTTPAGLLFPTLLTQQNAVIYTGFAHGAAGAGYFYLRLAQALGEQGKPYLKAAQSIGSWLRAIAKNEPKGINWYRREPDQMSSLLNQWCHGAPGVGLFFAKLYELSRDPQDLVIAQEAAKTTHALGHSFSSLCHGITGNAQLYLKLYQLTNDDNYLKLANDVGEQLWASWDKQFHYPSWKGEDGSHSYHNASLMTGNAGRAYFYLQLDQPLRLAMPFLE